MQARRILNMFLKYDLTSFIERTFQTVAPGEPYLHNWHIEAIAWHLERCFRREIKRLVITMPPRYGKSICASVAFPAWALGQDPTLKFICASYAQDLAEKLARDCRAVLNSPWYREVFPATIIDPKKNTAQEIATVQKGGRLATSVGGTLTGLGGNILIIDDAMKAGDANSKAAREAAKVWLDGTALSRLNNKNEDVIILIMQRLHIDDLVGHVLGRAGWEHLNLPAIAEVSQRIAIGPGQFHVRAAGDVLHPDREARAKLDAMKAELGSILFSAQYQQAPVPPSGNIIQRAWLKFYREPPRRLASDRVVQSWDTAMKPDEMNDYSVGTTWLVRGSDYYLLDLVRERLAYPDLKRRIIAEAQRHQAYPVLIEDKASGSIIQDLQRGGPVRPIPFKPEGDKIMRMSAQSAKFEAGQVHLPENAPWLGDLVTELMAFPDGRYDDQVDSIAQFLAWIDWGKRHTLTRGKF